MEKPTIMFDPDDLLPPQPDPAQVTETMPVAAISQSAPQSSPQTELERLLSAAMRADEDLGKLEIEKETIDSRLENATSEAEVAWQAYDEAMAAKRRSRHATE